MGSCINLLLSKKRDFIPSNYLVRFVINTVLSFSAFWITRSLRSIKFFNAIDSGSDEVVSSSMQYANICNIGLMFESYSKSEFLV